MRLFILAFFLISRTAISQGSLEDIVGSSSEKSRPISSTFSSTRIVNGHSVEMIPKGVGEFRICLLYTSPSPRDLSTSRMPSSA